MTLQKQAPGCRDFTIRENKLDIIRGSLSEYPHHHVLADLFPASETRRPYCLSLRNHAGSQLDYFLQQKANKDPKISRSRALRRFHWKVSLWEDTVYRLSLLTVRKELWSL